MLFLHFYHQNVLKLICFKQITASKLITYLIISYFLITNTIYLCRVFKLLFKIQNTIVSSDHTI